MDIADYNLDWEEHDHQIVQDLYRLQVKRPKDLRSKTFQVNGEEWTSWTMRDQLYKKHFYPTQARGLFTTRGTDGRFRIKVRGYDKFFNINETAVTQWSALEKDTDGPYNITHKENGCIIFITAASATMLLATSKHMIPEPKDDPSSHGGVGYNWLLKHLKAARKGPEELAAWLWTYRVTLVAELCDDEFEEHVLPYRTNNRGLYLHGINYNTMTLHTLPMDTVHQVAHLFGLRTVKSFALGNDVVALRRLADDIQKNNTENLDSMGFGGPESEGIVVRCHRSIDGDDFFFKVKNDTYLLYREYREVTKALVEVVSGGKRYHGSGDDNKQLTVRIKASYKKGGGGGGGIKKLKIRFDKTLHYIYWLKERIIDHPEWFYQFSNNKGIVDVRMAFEQDWQDGNVAADLKTGDLDIAIEWDTRW